MFSHSSYPYPTMSHLAPPGTSYSSSYFYPSRIVFTGLFISHRCVKHCFDQVVLHSLVISYFAFDKESWCQKLNQQMEEKDCKKTINSEYIN